MSSHAQGGRTILKPNRSTKISKSKRPVKALKSGRPPLLTTGRAQQQTSLPSVVSNRRPNSIIGKQSSRTTKTLINAHHNLHKSRAKALAAGNTELVAELDTQINQLGGLQAYQTASLTGQSAERGGDSSAILVKWLEDELVLGQHQHRHQSQPQFGQDQNQNRNKTLRVLEVGALSSRNAISRAVSKPKSPIQSVKRIDLKSQEPDTIEEVDFMNFAIPASNHDKYDVISLSLVLNYVPDSTGRGEMLRRTREFLRICIHPLTPSWKTDDDDDDDDDTITTSSSNNHWKEKSVLPCLFIVLPLPCLTNSRYMTADRFRELMNVLGYESCRCHQSAKLHYELFRWRGGEEEEEEEEEEGKNKFRNSRATFKKLEVNPGKGRNNFCISLES